MTFITRTGKGIYWLTWYPANKPTQRRRFIGRERAMEYARKYLGITVSWQLSEED